MGALITAGLRHNQCYLRVHEHPQDIRALSPAAVRHLHPGHTAHVPLHCRDDRQDAHQGHHQGNEMVVGGGFAFIKKVRDTLSSVDLNKCSWQMKEP